jgi:uncharacterized protein with LGFP repeats
MRWKRIEISASALAVALITSTALAQNNPSSSTDTPPLRKACGFELGDAIFAKWQAMQAAGTLGCPINSESEAKRSAAGTNGRWASFSPGTIGATSGYIIVVSSGPRAGAVFGIHGCVFKIYSASGGTGGVFGFPLTEEYLIPGGVRDDFEGGNIQYVAATDLCAAHLNPPT